MFYVNLLLTLTLLTLLVSVAVWRLAYDQISQSEGPACQSQCFPVIEASVSNTVSGRSVQCMLFSV